MINNLKFYVAQTNTVTADLKGNTERIIEHIKKAVKESCDICIFPETAITGYMCGSLWDRLDFIREQTECLKLIKKEASQYRDFTVIIGCITLHGIKRNGFPRLHNSVAVISNYCDIRYYHKQLLADADHHEDKRYFIPGKETKIFDIVSKYGNIKIGIPICEDSWYTDHHRDIPNEMVELGAELLISINQSYFYYGKNNKRQKLFSNIAKNNNVPLIMVNSCGIGDILKNIVIFDGGTSVFNNKGEKIRDLPQFSYDYSLIFKGFSFKPMNPLIYYNKYDEIVDALLFEQREYFKLLGIQKAQVHVSGGLDSAIVAALCVKALGKDNVILISNPSNLNDKSKLYVNHLEEKLGIKVYWNPIQDIFDKMVEVHTKSFNEEPSKAAQSCMHATLRTVQGLAASHMFKSGIVATGNHTEIVLGWATFHDIGSIGTQALIGDLTKMELFHLADYINSILYEDNEIIPYDIFLPYIDGTCIIEEFKPAAELPDANEDPIDYKVQSGICAALIRERKIKEDLLKDFDNHTLNIDYFENKADLMQYPYLIGREKFEKEIDFAISKMSNSVYKAAQGAPIVIISPRSRGFSNRETLINKYKNE